ncbi:MAG: hypothetical protein WKF41_18755 [Gaiellaceae bacterium]
MEQVNPFDSWLSSDPFRRPWIPVAQSASSLVGPPYIHGLLAQAASTADLIRSTTSPVHGELGDVYGAPAGGINQPPDFHVGAGDPAQAMYWPFVRRLEYPGGNCELEPLQQFLAHHAAWPMHTREEHRWYRLHTGEDQLIARWRPDLADREYCGLLEVFRPALLKYLFDMKLHFVFFFDVRADGAGLPVDWRASEETARRAWRAWTSAPFPSVGDHAQAVIHGVEMLVAPSEDPERDRSEDPLEFPIAMHPETGKPLTVTYPDVPNERTLWPGAGNNNFLTCLFFSPTVLERYYEDSRLYTVAEGAVRAWQGWMLQVALTEQGNLQAYLGDVVKMPRYEQEHWARHAIVDDRVPESRLRADLRAEFVDAPSHRTVVDELRTARGRVNEVAEQRFGCELFPDVEPINAPKVAGLRLPRDEVASYQSQLTALALLLTDSISGKFLRAAGAPEIPNAGSLRRLEGLLEQLASQGVRDDIAALFEIQLLRSKVGGVHDASDPERILARYNPKRLPWGDWFAELVERATDALGFVERTLARTGQP